jgi:hypothetical protein
MINRGLVLQACAAVSCLRCGADFCGLCLTEADGDNTEAHTHVVQRHGDLFFTPEQVRGVDSLLPFFRCSVEMLDCCEAPGLAVVSMSGL